MVYEEPVSPRGWLFLQPELPHVIHFTMSFEDPIDVPMLKASLASNCVKSCPRLRSLAVTDEEGQPRWRELPSIDIDKHVIIVPEEAEDNTGDAADAKKDDEDEENEAYVDKYVTSLVQTSTMRRDIPLWDVHVLPRRRRSLILRLHHALGDCLSLVAPLFAGFDSEAQPSPVLSQIREVEKSTTVKTSIVGGLAETVRWAFRSARAAWYTLPYAVAAPLLGMRLKEDKTKISGQTKAVGMPRKMASLTLSLDDMKIVKNKVNGTINDVFVGITACGLAKYFKMMSDGSSDPEILTAMNSVSLREEGLKDLMNLIKEDKGIEWGNNIGHFLHGIDLKLEETDPLNYVRKSKEALDIKKMSWEAHVSYQSFETMKSIIGPQGFKDFACNLLKGISILFSNVNGPSQQLALGKNKITKVGFTANGLPVPIDVRMMSYNGKAFVKVLTANKLIHDPKLLCMCMRDALQIMMAR